MIIPQVDLLRMKNHFRGVRESLGLMRPGNSMLTYFNSRLSASGLVLLQLLHIVQRNSIDSHK